MQHYLKIMLMVSLPFLLGTLHSTEAFYRRQTICQNNVGKFVPMQGSCSGFYMCIDGKAIVSSCGPFYRFNPNIGLCDHPDNVPCIIERPDILNVDDDENYYKPVMPMLPIMPTPPKPDYIAISSPGFPPYLPKPQGPEEVVIDESAGDICEYQRNGVLLPKADSCAHYYVCIMRRPYRRTCPPMMHFNAEKRLCQDPVLAQCLAKPFNSAVAFELATFDDDILSCARMPDGVLLPHNSSCEKYFNCEAGQSIEMNCPIGLHFSLRHQRCEWPKIARCMA